jgi:hypothetical protein
VSGALVRSRRSLPRPDRPGTEAVSLLQPASWLPRGGQRKGLAVDRRVAAILARWRVSRRLFGLNLVLVGVSVLCCIRISHALFAPALPWPSIAGRPISAPFERHQDIGGHPHSSGYYDLIATRSLFSPNRADSASSEATGRVELTTPALALYGVAISDETRVAFVQDLATKQISSYKIGDQLAGGRLERIEPDRVVVMRANGPIEVPLRRPKESEPQSLEQVVPARRARGRQE